MGLFGKKRIFIIDDNEKFLSSAAIILRQWKYDVLTAETGDYVLSTAKEKKPHLIILDIKLPGLDGFEVCSLLKKDPDTKDIPVILLTDLSKVGEINKGFSQGADEYITKPLDWNRLRQKIEKLI